MWDADVARGALDEERIVGIVPAKRLGQTWEVGKLVVYLCSDDADYVTGSVLTIDGALTSIPAA
jgi:glucose 1-dehydrogenase